MQRLFAGLLLSGLGLAALAGPAHAQHVSSSHHRGGAANTQPRQDKNGSRELTAENWSQHDTAVYVVSTLNLLHTGKGQPLTAILANKLNVARYDVYADQSVSNLYFITPRRSDGAVVAAFAYSMGSPRPQVLFVNGVHFHTSSNQHALAQYHSDAKVLIGSFSSTLPA